MYVPHLYPFICQWIFMLFPCTECWKQSWGTCISSNYSFLQIYALEWDCWIIQLYFQFFEEPPYCFPYWLRQFAFPLTVEESSLFSTPSPGCYLQTFFKKCIPLAGLGLGCSMWDLHCELCSSAACGILVPQPGTEPMFLAFQDRSLTT